MYKRQGKGRAGKGKNSQQNSNSQKTPATGSSQQEASRVAAGQLPGREAVGDKKPKPKLKAKGKAATKEQSAENEDVGDVEDVHVAAEVSDKPKVVPDLSPLSIVHGKEDRQLKVHCQAAF